MEVQFLKALNRSSSNLLPWHSPACSLGGFALHTPYGFPRPILCVYAEVLLCFSLPASHFQHAILFAPPSIPSRQSPCPTHSLANSLPRRHRPTRPPQVPLAAAATRWPPPRGSVVRAEAAPCARGGAGARGKDPGVFVLSIGPLLKERKNLKPSATTDRKRLDRSGAALLPELPMIEKVLEDCDGQAS